MKKLILAAVMLLLLLPLSVKAQPAFQKLYNLGMMAIQTTTCQTADKGFISAGIVNGFPPISIQVVKTDSMGTFEWARSYSTSEFVAVGYPACIRQTSDGGYIIAGEYSSLFTADRPYLLKITSTGSVSWSRRYGNKPGVANYVKQTSDGGYIFTGSVDDGSKNDSTSIYLVKTASNGALTWDRVFKLSSTDDDVGAAVEIVSDGYVLTGSTTQIFGTDTTYDIVMIKTDLSGTHQWTRTFGEDAYSEDGADIELLSGGGFLLTGYTDRSVSGLDGSDLYLMTTDASGNRTWSSAYSLGQTDMGYRVEQITGGYAVMGTTFSIFGGTFLDMFLMKTDAAGTPTLGMIYNQSMMHNLFTDGQKTSDGGFLLGGWGNQLTSMDFMTIKTNSAGVSGCLENAVTPVVRTFAPATETATPTITNPNTSASVTATVSTPTVTTTVLCANLPLTANAGNDVSICQYASTTLGGSPTANGGSGPYTYSWSPATYLNNSSAANPVMTPTTSGSFTYTVTVQDNVGTTASDAVVVTVNPTPTVTLSAFSNTCTATAPFALTGGSPAGGTYSGTGVSGGNFNPATAGAGTHTITYTVTMGSCSGSDSETITVLTTPNATITPAGPFCANASPVNLTAATGGGTWSGTGITNSSLGTFNPATAGVGSHVITYSFGSPCPSSDTETITVNAVANATITPPGILCESQSNITLTAAQGGGSWSGTGIVNASTGEYSPSAAGAGSHQVIYTIGGVCGDADTITISVAAFQDATITAAGPFCTDDPSVNLTAADGGGTWSGTGITNTSLGTFSPASAGAGNHVITYTISGFCGSTDTETIQVVAAANATINNPGSLCELQSSVTLTAAQGGGLWSGTGIVNGSTGEFSPSSVGAGSYQVIYSIGGMCGDADTLMVNVVGEIDASITPSGPYCSDGLPVNLAAANPGGSWTGTGITNASLGTFNPATAGSGNHLITYTISGFCGSSDTAWVQVLTASDASITPPGNLCETTSSVTLNAADPGGTWSGTGITDVNNGLFSPLLVGAGTYQVIYTISGTCGDSDTSMITVVAAADATISPAGPFCSDDPALNLTAATAGGSWTGTGITNSTAGTFNPALAGAGAYNIIYTIGGACGGADTLAITVNASADATITNPGTLCLTTTSVMLTAAQGGGSWTGTGIVNASAGEFSPALAGAGNHQVIYSIPGICGDSDTLIITVIAPPDATITPAGPFCSNGSAVNLNAASSGGAWSGTGITNAASGTFNPLVSGAGTFTITYTIAPPCGAQDTVQITVIAAADASITSPGNLCELDAPLQLSAAQSGGTWSGTGITNPSTGQFSPAISGAGTFQVVYTISGTCGDSDTVMITVLPAQDASIDPAGPFCANDAAYVLSAASSGGTWTGAGISSPSAGIFSPSSAGTGQHLITYVIPGSCGDSDSVYITVNENVSLSGLTSDESCMDADDGSIQLTLSGGSAPYSILWDNGAMTEDISDLSPGTYIVVVTDSNGCSSTQSYSILGTEVLCFIPHIYIPNIFSPNGDQSNDVLYVRGEGIKQLEFFVYDRWGEKVFETTDQVNGWDGSFRGKDMEPGVFAYYVKAVFVNDEEFVDKGSITLVR